MITVDIKPFLEAIGNERKAKKGTGRSWVRIPHGAPIATQTKTHKSGSFLFFYRLTMSSR